MNRRWMLAAVAAVGLAFSTLPFMPGCSKGEVGAAQSSATSPCDPKAQPANMAKAAASSQAATWPG